MGFSIGHGEKCLFKYLLLLLPYARKSSGPGPSTLPLVPEKDAPNVVGEVISDETRSAGGAERSVKR